MQWIMKEVDLPRQRNRRRAGVYRVAVIIAVVIALPLLAWSAVALVFDDGSDPTSALADDDSSTASPAADDASDTMGSYEVAHATRAAIQDCVARLAAADKVVAEGDIGIGHWNEHVQSRTDLLAGTITKAETKAIWSRTKLAGPDDQTRFAAAVTTYNDLPGCVDLDAAAAPSSLQAEIEACSARATNADAAVTAAIAGMGDWEAHLNAMAAHADGEMDAQQAQNGWVEAWGNAPTNIKGFHDARDAFAQSPGCGGANQ